jgi:hypothetical protein
MWGSGKRWDLIRNERGCFVYLTIDGREEGNTGTVPVQLLFLAELVGVRACCFSRLRAVRCWILRETVWNNKGNGDGKGADDAPLFEYRIERLLIRTIKKKSFS